MITTNWDKTYCGPPPEPSGLLLAWNGDVFLLAALALLAWRIGRQPVGAAAVVVLVVAFVSPLCALSSALFSARVVHHVLLVAVAAPLLAQLLAEQRSVVRDHHGPVAFAVSTLVLWAWHLPAAYDLALSQVGVYWLMQLSLLATATWFWFEVLVARSSPVSAITLIVAGFAQMGLLGAILSFAPEPVYAAHAVAPLAWGLSPLADQQLGGVLMWVPAGLPYAVMAILIGRQSWATLGKRA